MTFVKLSASWAETKLFILLTLTKLTFPLRLVIDYSFCETIGGTLITLTNGGTSCFLRYSDKKNFDDSATACENAASAAPDCRGRLAAVQSEVDWEAIKKVPGVTSSKDIWFGLRTLVAGKLELY